MAGLNIDAGRSEQMISSNHAGSSRRPTSKSKYGDSCAQTTHQTVSQRLGRWPANLLLDEEAAQLLDAQTGVLTSGMMKAGQQRKQSKGERRLSRRLFLTTATANGHLRRFRRREPVLLLRQGQQERARAGNDHPTVKPLALDEIPADARYRRPTAA